MNPTLRRLLSLMSIQLCICSRLFLVVFDTGVYSLTRSCSCPPHAAPSIPHPSTLNAMMCVTCPSMVFRLSRLAQSTHAMLSWCCRDGKLNEREFVLAMHLTTLAKTGLDVPATVSMDDVMVRP